MANLIAAPFNGLLDEKVDLRSVAARLDERFRKREEADLERLRQVVALAESADCLTHFVTSHFGEEIGPCGHCDRCRGRKPEVLPRSQFADPGDEDLAAIRELRDEGHAALRTPRQLARFLCGLSSAAATRARLWRHDAFGLLERMPFERVLALVEERR